MARNSSKFKAVILAGGSGERFWPLSTSDRPKQFLSIFGGSSLLRQSVTRLRGLVAPEDIYVITAERLVRLSRRELPELPRANIIGEPCRRDTAAAVALGAAVCGPGCTIGVFPADQLVAKPAAFRRSVKAAVKLANAEPTIVTLGIRPTYPATGFGYIDPASGRFVEKPDAAHAADYIEKGYLWNAGMFIATAATFRAAFEKHAPGLLPLFGARRSPAKLYPDLPKISFDFAVMEKLARVGVVAADCGWDDVGSYAALEKYHPELLDAKGNLVSAPKGIKVGLLGVSNLIVVSTPDGLLVADKAHIGEMKSLFR